MMPQRYPKLTCDALSDINSNASQQSEFTTSFFLFTILAPSLPCPLTPIIDWPYLRLFLALKLRSLGKESFLCGQQNSLIREVTGL